MPVLRHEADARAASAARHAAAASRRLPPTVTVPASARRSPTTVSASATLPLLPEPVSPTISPARTDEVDVRRTQPARRSPSSRSTAGADGRRRGRGATAVSADRLAGHRGDQRVVRRASATGAVSDVPGVAQARSRVSHIS